MPRRVHFRVNLEKSFELIEEYIKNNVVKVADQTPNNESSVESDKPGKIIADLIFGFKDVNPNYKTLFARNPQRKAIERMMEENGEERLRKIIAFLPRSNSKKFWPTITTPVELENKMGALVAKIQQLKDEKEKNNIGIAL